MAVVTAPGNPGTRTARSRAATMSVVLAILVIAGLGAAKAAVDLGAGALVDGRAAPHRISDDVKTSFGIVAVEYVRQVDGVTNRALAGASHGVQGLVDGKHAQIQVAVAVTNQLDHPILYRSRQFRLLITTRGRTTVQKFQGGDLTDTRVLPSAGIEGHLDFTVPARDARLALRFRDPGRASPIVIDLGPATFAPARGDAGHTH